VITRIGEDHRPLRDRYESRTFLLLRGAFPHHYRKPTNMVVTHGNVKGKREKKVVSRYVLFDLKGKRRRSWSSARHLYRDLLPSRSTERVKHAAKTEKCDLGSLRLVGCMRFFFFFFRPCHLRDLTAK
jgi:hypothetical protein